MIFILVAVLFYSLLFHLSSGKSCNLFNKIVILVIRFRSAKSILNTTALNVSVRRLRKLSVDNTFKLSKYIILLSSKQKRKQTNKKTKKNIKTLIQRNRTIVNKGLFEIYFITFYFNCWFYFFQSSFYSLMYTTLMK